MGARITTDPVTGGMGVSLCETQYSEQYALLLRSLDPLQDVQRQLNRSAKSCERQRSLYLFVRRPPDADYAIHIPQAKLSLATRRNVQNATSNTGDLGSQDICDVRGSGAGIEARTGRCHSHITLASLPRTAYCNHHAQRTSYSLSRHTDSTIHLVIHRNQYG